MIVKSSQTLVNRHKIKLPIQNNFVLTEWFEEVF